MASNTNPKAESSTQADAWLKPEQVDRMRTAIAEQSPDYLSMRNEVIIALLYDSGLRVGELVQLDVDMLELDDGILRLPSRIQKDYPNDNSPQYREIKLDDGTTRLLRQYLNTRWKDPEALLPSRQQDRVTTESVRNVVSQAAQAAEVRPYTKAGRGDASAVSPHTLRHSVAYRMLNHEDNNTLYDVRNRLRHRRIETTEQVYDHFDRI